MHSKVMSWRGGGIYQKSCVVKIHSFADTRHGNKHFFFPSQKMREDVEGEREEKVELEAAPRALKQRVHRVAGQHGEV